MICLLICTPPSLNLTVPVLLLLGPQEKHPLPLHLIHLQVLPASLSKWFLTTSLPSMALL
jgi:hypothetical protein